MMAEELDENTLMQIAFKDRPCLSLLGGKMDFLAKVCFDVAKKNLAGEVAECGVYKGGSARLLSFAFPHKSIYLFDSFSGFLKDDSIGVGFKKDHFSDTSLESVKKYLDDRPNCRLIQGWLPDSAKEVCEYFCLIHMDMDHYDSTRQSLDFFWPKLVSGGAIIFDDWDDHCCPGVRQAINEFFPDDQERIIHDNQCVIFK
jgi:hypothetical protein